MCPHTLLMWFTSKLQLKLTLEGQPPRLWCAKNRQLIVTRSLSEKMTQLSTSITFWNLLNIKKPLIQPNHIEWTSIKWVNAISITFYTIFVFFLKHRPLFRTLVGASQVIDNFSSHPQQLDCEIRGQEYFGFYWMSHDVCTPKRPRNTRVRANSSELCVKNCSLSLFFNRCKESSLKFLKEIKTQEGNSSPPLFQFLKKQK